MKKCFLFLAIFALISSSSFAQIKMFGAGLSGKIHNVEFAEKNLKMLTVGGVAEFGKEFGEEGVLSKSITGELFIGGLADDIRSQSIKNGFASELLTKINLESRNINPFGVYAGVSLGHISLLPIKDYSDKEGFVKAIGEEGYEEFIKMAEQKHRISENYVDLEVGCSYELDGLKFELSYGLIHSSLGLSIKYSLK